MGPADHEAKESLIPFYVPYRVRDGGRSWTVLMNLEIAASLRSSQCRAKDESLGGMTKSKDDDGIGGTVQMNLEISPPYGSSI